MLRSLYWKLAPRVKRGAVKKLRRFNLLDKLNLTLTLSINGRPFRIPIQGGIGYENVFMTEMWMVEVLKRVLPLRPGAFLDIGANIGQTLLKLRSVSSTVRYLGLEPNPACSAYLGSLILANAFDRTILIPVGLHKSRAILDLRFFAEGNTVDSGATLVQDPAFRPQHPVVFRQPVPVFPYADLAEFLEGGQPGVIKIDVEGGEMEVLDGLRELLETERCPILLEILPMGSPEDTASKNAQLEAFLAERGYLLFRVEKGGQRFVQFLPIRYIGLNTDPTGWDYLAIPAEIRKALETARSDETHG